MGGFGSITINEAFTLCAGAKEIERPVISKMLSAYGCDRSV